MKSVILCEPGGSGDSLTVVDRSSTNRESELRCYHERRFDRYCPEVIINASSRFTLATVHIHAVSSSITVCIVILIWVIYALELMYVVKIYCLFTDFSNNLMDTLNALLAHTLSKSKYSFSVLALFLGNSALVFIQSVLPDVLPLWLVIIARVLEAQDAADYFISIDISLWKKCSKQFHVVFT